MKRLLCALLAVLIVFSFSGCLKDDYETLTKDIEDLYEDTDELKDDIDEMAKKIEAIKADIKKANEDTEDLNKESDKLYLEKEKIQEGIEKVSSDGLGITKFEYEEYLFNLADYSDYFNEIAITFLPHQAISDSERSLYYYPIINGDITPSLFYVIEMCDDNLHIKRIIYYVEEELVDNFGKLANKYNHAMCIAFIFAKDGNIDDITEAYDVAKQLWEEKPVYNDEVLYGRSYSDVGYYITSVYDISD